MTSQIRTRRSTSTTHNRENPASTESNHNNDVKEQEKKSSTATNDYDNRTTKQLWVAAIKPPMYTVAITPILCGSLCYYADTHSIHISTMLTFLFAAILIIAWLNLTNDVFDFDTGVDEHKKESIVNLCGATTKARNIILVIALCILSVGIYLLSCLCIHNDKTILTCMLIAVFMGYMYQSPPFRLSYVGLGEPITFIAWTITVCSAYYTQLSSSSLNNHKGFLNQYPSIMERVQFLFTDLLFSKHSFLLATTLLISLPTTMILFCSHFHQEEDDKKIGKLSPIVRLGVARASKLLWMLIGIFIIAPFILFAFNLLPWQILALTSITIPRAFSVGSFVQQYHNVPSVVFVAKYKMVRLHFIHGTLMSLGLFVVGRSTPFS